MQKRKSEPFTAILALASIVALVGLGVAVPAFAQQGSFAKLKQMKVSGIERQAVARSSRMTAA